MLNRLTDALDFQAQALSLRSERQRLIASNIANADTPGYVAREMNFSQALREATGAGQPAAALAASRPGHIGVNSSRGGMNTSTPSRAVADTDASTPAFPIAGRVA